MHTCVCVRVHVCGLACMSVCMIVCARRKRNSKQKKYLRILHFQTLSLKISTIASGTVQVVKRISNSTRYHLSGLKPQLPVHKYPLHVSQHHRYDVRQRAHVIIGIMKETDVRRGDNDGRIRAAFPTRPLSEKSGKRPSFHVGLLHEKHRGGRQAEKGEKRVGISDILSCIRGLPFQQDSAPRHASSHCHVTEYVCFRYGP